MLSLKQKTFIFCLVLILLTGLAGPFLFYFIPGIIVFLNTGINLSGSLTILTGSLAISSFFFILAGFPGAIFSIIEVSALASYLMLMSRLDFGGAKTFLGGFLIMLIIFSASLAVFSDKDMGIRKNIEKSHQKIEEMYKKKHLDLSSEEKVKVDVFLKKLKDYAVRFYPAFFAVGIIITVFSNIILARFLSLKKNIDIFTPQFDKWKLPDNLIWFFIIAGILAFILNEPYRLIGENAVFTVSFLYLIQGFSVVNYFFNIMDFPYWVRILFYFFMILQWYGLVILAVIGMSDLWLDWRNRLSPEKEETNG
jgi:uncharacterized protein YybS (DUF2232 family)